MGTTTLLDQILEPVIDAFTPELAERLLALRADDALQARVEILRRKADLGTLTPEEDAEYKDFVEAVDVISILQAKARRYLTRQAG
jgi:hypothetical protein